MKKEDLIAMGLTDEQTQKVLDSLNGNFVTKTRFNEINEENKSLRQQITERDGQLETLKKSGADAAALQQQIADLQKANTEAQKQHEAEMMQLRLDNAVHAALTAAGARNAKAVRSLLDESGFKLTDKGEVDGLAAAIKAVQKSDPYLFEEKQQTQQTFKGFQPGASGFLIPGTTVDTSKMTYSELAAYMAQNPGVQLDYSKMT